MDRDLGEYDSDHAIPPEAIAARLTWLAGEGIVITTGARALLAATTAGAGDAYVERRLGAIERLRDTRRDDLAQLARYLRPKTRLGALAHEVGLLWFRLGRWLG